MSCLNFNLVDINKIYVAGHNGMLGSALVRRLGDSVIRADKKLLPLQRQGMVEEFFDCYRPEVVILAAAKVGGISANNQKRAEFIYENLQIQNNIIHCSYLFGIKKLLFFASSCAYPKLIEQPMKEEDLLKSPLEYTSEPFSIAKIAGIKMCESYYKQYGCDFISVIPCSLYGANDNFDFNSAHVLSSLLRRFHEAKIKNLSEVEVWGTGETKREFMHVDDAADACLHILQDVSAKNICDDGVSHLNVGTGIETSIAELAEKIAKITGFSGNIKYLTDKEGGTPRKLLDTTRLKKLKWKHKIDLDKGLESTYNWYKENYA
jgi:GDP-L-fucose synthase